MPTRTEIRNMTKAQKVDFACRFFEDTGNLRQEMEAMNGPDLMELLFNSGAGDEPVESEPMEAPEVEAKTARGPLDLGM